MSITIYDIAKAANVSIATISRVFNNNKNVSPITRKNILEIADKMGYHPKAFAQGLARKNSKIIMAVVPVISNYFFMEVLAGIQDKLKAYDYDLNIFNITSTDNSEDISQQVEYVIKKGMADGYLLISIHQLEKAWQRFKQLSAPIVLIDEFHNDFDSVSVDSVEGAFAATKHFIEKGYFKIGMLAASRNSKPVIDRFKGYKRALEDAGRIVDETLVIYSEDINRDGFTEKGGYRAMLQLLDRHPDIDACFCVSDIQALGAIKAMKDKDINIPIIGFDDIPISKYLGLSTMRQPMYEMGALAFQKLMERIQSPGKMVSHTIYSPELVIREQSDIKVPSI